jgi:adenosylcobinamide-GDP ribazoletransferase
MKTVLAAVVFLTRFPLPVHVSADGIGRAARWFPLVGALLGGIAAAIAAASAELPRLPPVMGALALVSLGAWVTGAIHLDGLADTADGFGGGRTRDEVLRIMRDPVVGSFGVLAIVLATSTKVAAIASLLERQMAPPFLVVAATLSRWTVVVLGAWLPYARPEGGLGQPVTQLQCADVLWATAVTGVVTVAAVGRDALIPFAVAVLVSAGIGRMAMRRIGGVTGDVFGASVELTETLVLAVGVLMAGRA